jgi:hypothetical protein
MADAVRPLETAPPRPFSVALDAAVSRLDALAR